VLEDELRRCGMCQQMRSDGTVSDEGKVFICTGWKAEAAKFLEIVGSLGVPPEGSKTS
jgi:hypothetical protein